MASRGPSGRDLTVGHDIVDGEHGVQVQLVEALQAALAGGAPRAQAEELMDRLVAFTDMHFGSEELLMRLHSYARYGEHVDEHRRLLEALHRLHRSLGEGQTSAGLADELRRWLVGHIAGADRDFGASVAGGSQG